MAESVKTSYAGLFAELVDKVWADRVKGIGRQLARLHSITPLSREKGWILDVGCGSGQEAEILLNNGYRVIGIDPSSELQYSVGPSPPAAN